MTDAQFQAAFEQHKHAVYRFAWRMCGSPSAAEDVTQDAFVELLRHPDRFDEERGSLRAFLLAVARHLALKRWRKEHRLEPLDDDALMAHPIDLGRGTIGDAGGQHVLRTAQRSSHRVRLRRSRRTRPRRGVSGGATRQGAQRARADKE